jgi:hypothetical protein
MALLPKESNGLAFIMEFKRVEDPVQLDAAAAQALRQIDERWYGAELRQHGVERVMKIGMGLRGSGWGSAALARDKSIIRTNRPP